MNAAASRGASEKATSAWRNARARLEGLGPDFGAWLRSLEPIGEREGSLVLVDRAVSRPCRRCEALVGRAVTPLGYRGAEILTRREPESQGPR